jgi:hypothetical protein
MDTAPSGLQEVDGLNIYFEVLVPIDVLLGYSTHSASVSEFCPTVYTIWSSLTGAKAIRASCWPCPLIRHWPSSNTSSIALRSLHQRLRVTGSDDPSLDLVYWGVGNPAPGFQGDVRLGDKLFTDSMFALHAGSGKLAYYFQFTPHDEHDRDSTPTPILADIPIKGVLRRAILIANRGSTMYLIEQPVNSSWVYLSCNKIGPKVSIRQGVPPSRTLPGFQASAG